MDNYFKILLAYQTLPRSTRSRTFMDVAGYPNRENACSNILAFYLDPAEEHGLGDLLLTSFFRLCLLREEDFPKTHQVRIQREYGTADQKRIDLALIHPDFTIGIENKIYHWLANDLRHYAEELTQLSAGRHEPLKIVLGLHRMPGPLPGDFQSRTYRELWAHVRRQIGQRIHSANPKWLTHLIDFMAHTENLTGSTFEIRPTDQFFIEHQAVITRMNADLNEFLTRLGQRVKELMDLMGQFEEIKLLSKPLRIYSSRDLVFDLWLDDGKSVAMDLWLNPSGWELQLWGRNNGSHHYALKLGDSILGGTPKRTDNGQRCLAGSWPLETDLGIISASVNGWIRNLVDASSAVDRNLAASPVP